MDEDTKLLIKSYTAFWIVLTLILAAFLFVKDACAATPFIEIGQSKYEKPPCGLWHQECADYGVDWNMKPSMFRIGLDHDGWRLSYADLGVYSLAGYASQNEDCILAGGGQSCPGPIDFYHTTGSMRAFLISRVFGQHAFVELGAGRFRQSFALWKDDGYTYDETLHGFGWMVGVGARRENLSFGLYTYITDIGGRFGGNGYMAGVGQTNVIVLGWRF
ncbi:MAG TPA: hypothetical protein VIH42_04100 [Thermoguttaceae bacterium]